MAQVRTRAAFDVHVSGVAATLERDSGDLRVRRLPGGSDAVAGFATGLLGPVRATYEAGPTAFVLVRKLQALGIECVVCAPRLIRVAGTIGSRPIAATPCSSPGFPDIRPLASAGRERMVSMPTTRPAQRAAGDACLRRATR